MSQTSKISYLKDSLQVLGNSLDIILLDIFLCKITTGLKKIGPKYLTRYDVINNKF